MKSVHDLLSEKSKNKDKAFFDKAKNLLDFLIKETTKAFDINLDKEGLDRAMRKFLEASIKTSTNKMYPKLEKLPTREKLESLFASEIINDLESVKCIEFCYIGQEKEIAYITPLAFALYKTLIHKSSQNIEEIDLVYRKHEHECLSAMIEQYHLRKVIGVSEAVFEKLDPWEAFALLLLLLCGAIGEKYSLDFRKGAEDAVTGATLMARHYVETVNKLFKGKLKLSMPIEEEIIFGVFRKRLWQLSPKVKGMFVAKKSKDGSGYSYYLNAVLPNGEVDMDKVQYLIKQLRSSAIGEHLREIFKELKNKYEEVRYLLKEAGGRHKSSLLIDIELLLEEEI